MQQPIVIPSILSDDRAVRNLITQWRNCCMRYRICCTRVNWNTNKNAGTIEKKRRKEKWELVSRILEIERTLILWCAKATHHPDIWTSKKPDTPLSRLQHLQREYYTNHRQSLQCAGEARKKKRHTRSIIVLEIRAIEYSWMRAVFTAVYPELGPANAILMHPTELRPRKLKKATERLTHEFAP